MSMVAPHIDQYPVTIVTGRTPTLAASFRGPFQVINGSAVNTVWLADNPALRSGFGIPLYPGTGMVWTGSQGTGELWAVQDTASTAASDLIIGNDVKDWQPNPIALAVAILNSGIIMVDNPVTLFASAMAVNTTQTFDVTTYQCIQFQSSPSNVVGTPRILTLDWLTAAGTVVCTDTWGWAVTPDTRLVQESVPCRAATLRVSVTGGGANSQSVIIVGSRRPFNTYMRMPNDRNLGTASNGALPNNTAMTVTPVRYDGPLIVAAFIIGGTGAYELKATDNVTGVIIGADTGVGVGTRGISTLHMVATRNSWTVAFTNLTGGAATANLSVTASPEAT